MKALASALVALVLASGGCLCPGSRGPVVRDPPPRPSRVPAAAYWSGGIDGGHFFLCEPAKKPANAFRCRVYHEVLGELLFDGVVRSSGGPIELTRPDSDAAFDGDTMYAKGEALETVKGPSRGPR